MSDSAYAQFKIYAPPIKKECTLNEDGTLTIVGIASTTNEDLDGELVSEQALHSMVKQAVGLNLHLDHNHHYDGGIGVITNAEIISNSLWITAKILKEHAQGIKERLDLGMNFGFSIGGLPLINNRSSNVFVDVNLLEISLTLLPANWDTFGTVMSTKGIVESKCLSGACNYILKNKRNDIMKKDASGTLSEEEIQQVIDIVEESNYNMRPLITEDIKNELLPFLEDVVTQIVSNLVPQVEEKELDDELIEEEVEEEELPEEPVEEEIEEKEEELPEEPVEEEIEEKEGELPEEPVEEEIEEKEGELPEEPVEEEEEEVEVLPLDEKAMDVMVENIFKKLNQSRKSSPSKLKKYKKSKKTKVKKAKFLDGKTRDKYGRNRKYI